MARRQNKQQKSRHRRPPASVPKGTKKSPSPKQSSTTSSTSTYTIPQAPSIDDIRDRAQRDIDMQTNPVLDEIQRQIGQQRDQHAESQTAYGNIYQGLQRELGGIQDFGQRYGDVSKDLRGDLGQLGESFDYFAGGTQAGQPPGAQYDPNWGLPPEYAGAQQAAMESFGGVSQDAQEQLALMRGEQVGYNRSIHNQAAVDLSGQRTNALEDMRDAIDELRQGRMDILEQTPDMLAARLDELRQSRWEQQLSLGEFGLRQQEQAAAEDRDQALIDLLAKKKKNAVNTRDVNRLLDGKVTEGRGPTSSGSSSGGLPGPGSPDDPRLADAGDDPSSPKQGKTLDELLTLKRNQHKAIRHLAEDPFGKFGQMWGAGVAKNVRFYRDSDGWWGVHPTDGRKMKVTNTPLLKLLGGRRRTNRKIDRRS